MEKLKMLSYGSLDVGDLKTFNKKNNFFISVEFDICTIIDEGVTTYFFFLADVEGVKNYINKELEYDNSLELNNILIVSEYEYDFLKNFLLNKVEKIIELLSEDKIWDYLNSNFHIEDD